MNFLIISPFAPDTPRGNSMAASRIMEGLNMRGHRAMIAAPEDIAGTGEVVLRQSLRKHGVSSVLFPSASERSPGTDPYKTDALREGMSWRDGFRPDFILVLHAYHCADAIRILKSRQHAPVFLSIRGTDANEMLDDKEKSAPVLSAMRNADMIIVFAEDIRDGIIAGTGLPREKFEIIPNGLVIPNSNIDFRKRLSIPPDAFVFASLAGLREVKRPLLPPQCLARMRQIHPNLLFMHAGPELEKTCAAEFSDLASRNTWILRAGVIRHSETDSFLRAADVFVSASRSEGMPHAVREAMYQGIPCLLSDIPGHRRIADEAMAVFFDGEEDFVGKARSLVENHDLRRKLGCKAAEAMKSLLGGTDEIGALIRLAERNSKP